MIDREIIAVFHYDDKGSKCCGREPYRYAEEIIRCKECKRRKKNGFCLEHNRYEKNDSGYCSYGVRLE